MPFAPLMIVSRKPWHILGVASIVLSRSEMYSVCSNWTAAAAKNTSTLCPSLMACAVHPNPTIHLNWSTSGLVTNLMKKCLLISFVTS